MEAFKRLARAVGVSSYEDFRLPFQQALAGQGKPGLRDRAAALQAAREMTAHDALAAHAELELGIQPGQYTNPWHAAWASAVSFAVGALVPLLTVLLSPSTWAVTWTAVAVLLALVATGVASAHLGGAPRLPAALRNVAGGLLAMGVTYAIGRVVGAQL